MKKLTFYVGIFAIFVMLHGATLAGDCLDVSENHWAYSAIKKASPVMQLCTVTNGYKFNGEKLVNRYDMARFVTSILDRWGLKPQYSIPSDLLHDVPQSHPDYKAIQTVMGAEILTAYNNRFHGEKYLNRYQLAVVLSRLLNKKGIRASTTPEKQEFQDLPENHWAYTSVQHSVRAGILQGYNNKFHGNKVINQYQLAVIIARLGDLVPETFTTADTLMEEKIDQKPALDTPATQ